MHFDKAELYVFDRLKRELPPELSYHSVEHTKDVVLSAGRICAAENVHGSDRTLVLTAALYHDTGYIFQALGHEEISCTIARKSLPEFDYATAEIDRICEMIMATEIPQRPKNHLGEILADADLDYLGRDDFFVIGARLYAEMQARGTIRNWQEWQSLQKNFLENHHYFTACSVNSRQAKKLEHLEEVKKDLQQR